MNIETEETTVRRIRVTGPYDEGGDVMTQLHEDGWRIKRTGPYTDEEMHPEVNTDRFLIIAEKESDSPPSGVLESYVLRLEDVIDDLDEEMNDARRHHRYRLARSFGKSIEMLREVQREWLPDGVNPVAFCQKLRDGHTPEEALNRAHEDWTPSNTYRRSSGDLGYETDRQRINRLNDHAR